MAVQNGFEGSEQEWLNSLQGATPEIIDGFWWVGGFNTGVSATATPDLSPMEMDEIKNICK